MVELIHPTRAYETKEVLGKMGFKAIVTVCPTLGALKSEHCANILRFKAKNVGFILRCYKSKPIRSNG